MPIPILVVMSILGLFIYLAIGAVMAALIATRSDDADELRAFAGESVGTTVRENARMTLLVGTLCWPLAIAAAVGFVLAWGAAILPFKMVKAISRYTAQALLHVKDH